MFSLGNTCFVVLMNKRCLCSQRAAGAWLIFLSCLSLLSGCCSYPVQHGIPNLATVDTGVYRGGQPVRQEGWVYLHDFLKVSNVVKLNLEREASDNAARALGMRVIYLPITTMQQLESGPKVSTVGKAVSWMLQPGTFVHCSHGRDRTGEIVGVYRVWVDHWPKERAYREMKEMGFRPMPGLYYFWLYQIQN